MGRSASDEDIGEGGTRFGEPLGDENAAGGAPERTLGEGAVIDGKYRLERILGEGGMGSVWHAHNLQLDVPVAIKLLRSGADLAQLSERMKLEARSAARLVHPAIVRVFDIGTTESGDPFIVMELLNGQSLADVLDSGRMDPIPAVQALLPIAEALVLAHSKGIIHRDLKPQNVFMAEEAERLQPKLLDFGIAKLIDAGLAPGSITDTGIMLGSPDYMSPEQARGQTDLDHRTDIWSFSVVLYECLTGACPFHGANYNALMRAIIDEPPLPIPAELKLDPGLSSIIERGLSKQREERPESMQALGRELAEWLLRRGVAEDASGGAIERKWTGRAVQRSMPIIPTEIASSTGSAELPRAPRLPAGDTLVSASEADFDPSPRESQRARWSAPALRPLGLALAATLVALALLVWALGSDGDSARAEQREPEQPSLAEVPTAPVAPQPALPAAPASDAPEPIVLAPTPPSPSANPLPSNAPHKPATLVAPPSRKPSPTLRPSAEPRRDDSNELLQAY